MCIQSFYGSILLLQLKPVRFRSNLVNKYYKNCLHLIQPLNNDTIPEKMYQSWEHSFVVMWILLAWSWDYKRIDKILIILTYLEINATIWVTNLHDSLIIFLTQWSWCLLSSYHRALTFQFVFELTSFSFDMYNLLMHEAINSYFIINWISRF